MRVFTVFVILLLLITVLLRSVKPSWLPGWEPAFGAPYEGFQDAPSISPSDGEELMNPYAPAQLSIHTPYHLMDGSRKGTVVPSCQAKDQDKTGNFRQTTNNYKREEPEEGTPFLKELSFYNYKRNA